MHYHHQFGVLVPFVKKHFKLIVLALAGIFILSQVTLLLTRTEAADTGFQTPNSTNSPNNWDVNTVANLQTADDDLDVNDNDNSEQGYDEFNFSIPDGSDIDGIEILADARSSDFFGCKLGIALSWNDGDDYTSYQLQNIEGDAQSNFFTETYGGATDTWGRDWDDDDFSNDNFVVKIKGVDDSSSCAPSPNPPRTYVDFLRVKVYYSDPTGSIKIEKNVKDGTSSQGFTFTTDAPGGNFTLHDDGQGGGSSSKTFSDITLGTTYTFTEDNVPGWELDDIDCTDRASVQINGSTVLITPTANKKDVECKFENKKLPTGDIAVKKYEDKDNDNKKDGDEGYLSGWTIVLYNSNWEFVSSFVSENDNGEDNEIFENLTYGTYYVCEVSQAGWMQTDPASDEGVANNSSNKNSEEPRCHQVTLSSNNKSSELRFGNNQIPTGDIKAKKFGDSNGNGVKDDEESYLPGWTIRLYDNQWNLLTTDDTDDPWAKFEDQQVGQYYICEVQQTGWEQTAPKDPDGVVNGSSATDESSRCFSIDLTKDEREELNFGNAALPKLTLVKQVEGSQEPASSWTLSADPADDGTILGGVGGATGQYAQAGVTYTLGETGPTGYTASGWSCTPEQSESFSLTGDQLTMQYGADVTCTITNTWDPPEATVIASKIVCDDEALLPNDGYTSINQGTAQDFVNQNPGCELVDDWDYQYRLSGSSSPEPTGYGELAGWTTFASGDSIPLSGNTTIQLREVLPTGYIPFTGQHSQDDVSAEFYCHTDAANYDNWEWIQNPQDDATYYCVAWNVQKNFTVHADKVICDSEEYLPNWGDHSPTTQITATTAQDHVDDSQGHCWLAQEWPFQWSPDNVGNPGDNQGEVLGGDWTTFSGSVSLHPSDTGSGNRVWFREVWNDDYIEFTGQNTDQDVSAELYCGNDVLNYDNWEWIADPQPEADYYCVGFNVLKPVTLSAVKIECVSEIYLPNWGNDDAGDPDSITATTADDWLAEGDNAQHCEKVPWDFQWATLAAGDPEDNAGALAGWNDFTNGSATVWLGGLTDNDLRVREVWNSQYIPFTGQNTDQDVSAEIYCGTDVLHYDNWEWMDDAQPGDTYHCVAWNVHVDAGQIQGRKFHDLNADGNRDGGQGGEDWLDGWEIRLYDENWSLLQTMQTGDDTTAAGNVAVGQYRFVGLGVGTYFVCETQQLNWVQTRPTETNNRPEHPNEEGNICYRVRINHPEQHRGSRTFGNYEAIGQIQGLVYNDEDESGAQDPGELGLENWKVWLLTRNSPHKIVAEVQTGSDGSFVFQNLAYNGPGNEQYYVCQDIQSGWLQTQINAAGTGLDVGSLGVGDTIPDPTDTLDSLVDQFCYRVVLDPANPTSAISIFGNFQQGQTLGDTDTNDPGGDVLADTDDGEVLADTGSPAILALVVGLALIGSAAILRTSKKQ